MSAGQIRSQFRDISSLTGRLYRHAAIQLIFILIRLQHQSNLTGSRLDLSIVNSDLTSSELDQVRFD